MTINLANDELIDHKADDTQCESSSSSLIQVTLYVTLHMILYLTTKAQNVYGYNKTVTNLIDNFLIKYRGGMLSIS